MAKEIKKVEVKKDDGLKEFESKFEGFKKLYPAEYEVLLAEFLKGL